MASERFGLYVHWPFCQSKCPYCDFNSHVVERIDLDRWRAALLSEIDRVAAETSERQLDTVFFGGGTPSLMPPDLVGDLLDRVRLRWRVANDWEVTLEANPGSSDASRFEGYRAAGVNRLSMGVQALNNADLRRLGRLHDVRDAQRAFNTARRVFGTVSFDLIYARQDQTPEAWKEELGRAIELAVDHLSLYQLTVEDGTAFGDRHARGGLRGLPDEDRSVALYEVTQEACDKAGMPAYEVSNHAKKGAECRHNLIYWRGDDYAGVGPGAHGRLALGNQRWATETVREPGAWLEMVEKNGSGEVPRTALSSGDQGMEYLLMGLRLSEGIDRARYEERAGTPLDPAAESELVALGLIEPTTAGIRTTRSGRMVLNAVIGRLLRDT